MGMKTIDLSKQKFGKLTAICREPNRPGQRGGSWWTCLCECGATCSRQGYYLRNSTTTPSCGCTRSSTMKEVSNRPEIKAARAKVKTKHGATSGGLKSTEYSSWRAMKTRCYNPRSEKYSMYGGRGITVCDAWISDFSAFLHDMGQKPDPAYTIDRIDPNKGYSPDNCRWASTYQQSTENKRDLKPLIVGDLRFPSTNAACRHFGIGASTYFRRLQRGLSVFDALSTPLKPK